MTSYISFIRTIFFDKNENDSKTYDPNGVEMIIDDFVKTIWILRILKPIQGYKSRRD